MKHILKKYFIPHEENNYHPHILHTKRALLYSAVFVAMKCLVISFALLLPLQVFVMPDVLQEQGEKIIDLTNEIRTKKGLEPLRPFIKLYNSGQLKAQDMAEKEYFEHVGPDGRGLKDYMGTVEYEYKYAGENLAMGFADAQSLVNAWVNSPTHYANLIDTDYSEFGIGMRVGEFEGMPTVYVAQHFGAPKAVAGVKDVGGTNLKLSMDMVVADEGVGRDRPVPDATVEEIIENPEIPQINPYAQNEGRDIIPLMLADEGQSMPEELPSVVYNADVSRMYWKEEGDKTLVTVKAYVVGDVEDAMVRFHEYSIELFPSDQPFVYHGQVTIFGTAAKLFKVVTTPSISIRGVDGMLIQDTIMWNTVQVVNPTPVEKYTRAQTTLGGFTSIFKVSRNVYLGFIIFFALALVLKIFIAFRKQHHHVIIQTLLLIGLLVVLIEI
ncbi:hypothetical protein C0581_03430 [Candidatus Parcubacteria bacterium]|nr:MAG: hypothetical protein C0581_03430 [Candidatus Parcubacteria bacterium]